jgi:multiple sugar transport system substrate-binding protein
MTTPGNQQPPSRAFVTRRQVVAGGAASLAGILALRQAPAVAQTRELHFIKSSHFVPASDAELKRQGEEWGKQNRATVAIDAVPTGQLNSKKAAVVTAQAGADIAMLWIGDQDLYFDHLIDLNDIAEDVGKKLGPWANPEDFKIRGVWKAVPWYAVVWPMTYRADLLEKVGEKVPDTWEDLYRAGKKLKAQGNPVGIALAASDDANFGTRGLLWSYGSSYVARDGKTVTINNPRTVEAVEFMKRFYKDCMEQEVLSWDDSNNNRCMNASKCSFIFNPTSAYEAAKKQAIKVRGSERLIHEVMDHALPPRGPVERATSANYGMLGVFKFSKHADAAKDFLRYHYEEAQQSKFIETSAGYNIPFLEKMTSHPIWSSNPKYKFVRDIMKYTHPPGYPGPQTAASQVVMALHTIPEMFARAATDKMSTKDAIAWAEQEITEVHAGRKRVTG